MRKAFNTRYSSSQLINQTESSAGTQRVWQSLPRHLRRRAASHDVRYVPARLRQKARAEVGSTHCAHFGETDSFKDGRTRKEDEEVTETRGHEDKNADRRILEAATYASVPLILTSGLTCNLYRG